MRSCTGGWATAPARQVMASWQARVGFACFRSSGRANERAGEHYCWVWREQGAWKKLDDAANGGVAVALDDAEAETWGGTTNGDWAPVLMMYVRVDSG